MKKLVIYDSIQQYVLLRDIDKNKTEHLLYAEHSSKIPMVLVYQLYIHNPHYKWAHLRNSIIAIHDKEFKDIHYAIRYIIDTEGYSVFQFDTLAEMFLYHINHA